MRGSHAEIRERLAELGLSEEAQATVLASQNLKSVLRHHLRWSVPRLRLGPGHGRNHDPAERWHLGWVVGEEGREWLRLEAGQEYKWSEAQFYHSRAMSAEPPTVKFTVRPSRSPDTEHVTVKVEGTGAFQITRAEALDLAEQLADAAEWLNQEASQREDAPSHHDPPPSDIESDVSYRTRPLFRRKRRRPRA